jgi:flagellar motor switch protein FliN/FliY
MSPNRLEDQHDSNNLQLLRDVELPVMLRFGSTRLPLEEIIRLSTGSLIEFEGSPNDPVELLVNGRVIAWGEAVIVQNSYGIRISGIATPRERIFPAEADLNLAAAEENKGEV